MNEIPIIKTPRKAAGDLTTTPRMGARKKNTAANLSVTEAKVTSFWRNAKSALPSWC